MRVSKLLQCVAMVGVVALLPLVSCGLGGCSSAATGDRTQSDSSKQDQALNNPMAYQVNPPTVDGQGDKQGLNRDMNDLINP